MDTKNPIKTEEIDLFDYWSVSPSEESRERNSKNYGSVKDLLEENAVDQDGKKLSTYLDNCFLCDRPLDTRKAAWVHLSTQGGLIPTDSEFDYEAHEDFSQGWFPIGASCFSKIPAKYRGKKIG